MEYQMLRDEILTKLLKADDQDALREIYHRYWKRLYLAIMRKVRAKEIAEELVQNIFVSLWNRRYTLRVEHLAAYFDRAAKYQVINYLKSKILDKKRLQQIGLSGETETSPGDCSLVIHELSRAIDLAIRELPPKTQLVFRLSRYENRSVREISQSMNISEKAVEYHITRSLKMMRMQLRDFILPAWVLLLLLFC